MSLFGKILAVVNIFAAAAFFYLVAADWGERQKWTYAVFRQTTHQQVLAKHRVRPFLARAPSGRNQVEKGGCCENIDHRENFSEQGHECNSEMPPDSLW